MNSAFSGNCLPASSCDLNCLLLLASRTRADSAGSIREGVEEKSWRIIGMASFDNIQVALLTPVYLAQDGPGEGDRFLRPSSITWKRPELPDLLVAAKMGVPSGNSNML